MDSSRIGCTLTVTVLVLSACAPVSAADSASCAFIAANEAHVGNAASVGGDLGTNDRGGRVQLGRHVVLADGTTVTGDRVGVSNGSSLFDVDANVFAPGRGVLVRGAMGVPGLPLFDPFCPLPAIQCGGADVVVHKGDPPRVLAPGQYGDVRLENGTTLELSPGSYQLCSLRGSRRVEVRITGASPSTVDIAGELRLENGSHFGPVSGTSLPTVNVGGDRVRLGAGVHLEAFLAAPAAELRVRHGGTLTGSACSKSLVTGHTVTFDCAAGGPSTSTSTTSTSTTSSTSSPPATSTTLGSTTTLETTTTTTSTIPPPPNCGDAILQPGEECDDGNTIADDGCTDHCTICGNSVVTPPETCDDGNHVSGDGCSAVCRTPVCGDGFVDPPETCDDGNTTNFDDCPSNCIEESCNPDTATTRTATVSWNAPSSVGGLIVVVDYPEGKVFLPGTGGVLPPGTLTGFPSGTSNQPNKLGTLGYALREVLSKPVAITPRPGTLFEINFQDCQGATPATEADFTCVVQAATAPDGLTPVEGATCTVSLSTSSSSTTTSSTSTTSGPQASSTTASVPSTTTSSTTTEPPSTTSTTSSSTSTTTSTMPTALQCGANGVIARVITPFDPLQIPAMAALRLDLRYPATVSIPGSGLETDDSRLTIITGIDGTTSFFDRDDDTPPDGVDDTVRLLYALTGGRTFPPGNLADILFDCTQGSQLDASAFACHVLDASDPVGTAIPNPQDIPCSVASLRLP